jgi:hypothetical protein
MTGDCRLGGAPVDYEVMTLWLEGDGPINGIVQHPVIGTGTHWRA